jgi:hypothetical protein
MQPNGNTTHAETRWTESPLYLAMVDALTECGRPDLIADGRITHPDKWQHDGAWPFTDTAQQAHFLALWTAKAQARCGINPRVVTPERGATPTATLSVAERGDQMAAMYERGDETSAIAQHFAVDIRIVQRALRVRGVPVREKVASAQRQRIVALYTASTDTTTTSVGKALGISRQAVQRQLRLAGIAIRPPDTRAASRARWDRATPEQRRAHGQRSARRWMAMTPEEKRAMAARGVQTRRANARRAA